MDGHPLTPEEQAWLNRDLDAGDSPENVAEALGVPVEMVLKQRGRRRVKPVVVLLPSVGRKPGKLLQRFLAQRDREIVLARGDPVVYRLFFALHSARSPAEEIGPLIGLRALGIKPQLYRVFCPACHRRTLAHDRGGAECSCGYGAIKTTGNRPKCRCPLCRPPKHC